MAVDPNIKKKADDIRNKIYGKEVRESLASGLEEMSSDVVENEGRQSVVESRQSVVEGRQDSVESQWQSVSDEMTDKDVISAPEIIAARNGESNLKARLDKENQEVTEQLAQTDKQVHKINLGESYDVTTKGRKPRTMISFTDDDCLSEVYTELFPLIQELDIPYTIACPANDIGKSGYMNLSQLKEMYDYGVTIASHGYNQISHDTSSEKEIYEDLDMADKKFKEWGIYDVDTICYVQGRTSIHARNVVSKFYRAGFLTEPKINKTPYEQFSLGRHGLFPSSATISEITGFPMNSMEHYKALVDKTIAEGGWLVFMTHVWFDTFNADELRELVTYIRAKGVEIVDVNEAINTTGNIITAGDYSSRNSTSEHFVVGSDGKIVSKNIGREVYLDIDSIASTMKPNEFEREKIIYANVPANRPGFPVTKTGKVITSTIGVAAGTSYNNWMFAYQEFIGTDGTRYTRSSADNAGTVWTPWAKLDNTLNYPANTFTASNKPSDFKVDSVSSFGVSSASGFPLGSSGTVYVDTTAVLSGSYQNWGYCQQKFISLSGDVFIRNSASGGSSWKDWVQLNSPILFDGFKSNIALKSVSEFDKGITYTMVDSATKEGMPENSAGTLLTVKPGTNDFERIYAYQEYITTDSNKWVRGCNSTGAWKAWKKVTADAN